MGVSRLMTGLTTFHPGNSEPQVAKKTRVEEPRGEADLLVVY